MSSFRDGNSFIFFKTIESGWWCNATRSSVLFRLFLFNFSWCSERRGFVFPLCPVNYMQLLMCLSKKSGVIFSHFAMIKCHAWFYFLCKDAGAG